MCSAGLRTGQTGQLPRGLHKKGPPQKHIFFIIWPYRTVYIIRAYVSTFASFILITRFILKSMDKIRRAQNSNQSAGRVDVELAQQAEQFENYWLSVLKRLISVIKFSCERGLALRDENEIMGSAVNGNYLGMLELLAQYDDFLKQHIQKHANLGSGHTNYLSSTICEELVHLMGKRVLDDSVSRIKRSRYYSVTLDSTPDEGHVDQLTLVFRSNDVLPFRTSS